MYPAVCYNRSMKKRYLFFDIDGTLAAGGYGNTYIPDSCRRALQKLAAAGHFLCICTGRSQAMALPFLEQLGFRNMISDGGYGITLEDKLIGIEPLDHDRCTALVDECREKGFAWALQTDNSCVRSAPDTSFYDQTRDTYMETRVVPGLTPENTPSIYKMYVACRAGEEQQLKTLRELPWCRFFAESIFVEPCDKARGIRKMMEHLQADPADAIVFGDGLNDLSMFIPDWTCVAMGNAVPELKERADLVTTDADRDGIWNACLRLGLFE